MRRDRQQAAILARIKEAEGLSRCADDEQSEDRDLAMIRWFVVADETTGLILLAKETLDDEELESLKRSVENEHPGAWAKYQENVRRWRQFAGREFYEEPGSGRE